MARRRAPSAPTLDVDRFSRFAEVVHRLACHYRFHVGEPSSDPRLARWYAARVSFLVGETVPPATMAELWRVVAHWPPEVVTKVVAWADCSVPVDWSESMWGPELGPAAPGQPARAYLVGFDEWPWPPT